MDVSLYVYDLSKGLARMYSLALTGTQMDAIYHTSIVLNGVEYYFGQGIQTAVPGSTHHGQPLEIVKLGTTELPHEVIEEYLGSLATIYTPESYDLFLHNCNNFTQDLSMFLVGKSIPEHIINLPRTFLETPFGQMMKPQIEMALKGVTQGTGVAPGPSATARPAPPAPQPVAHPGAGTVRIVRDRSQLESELSAASHSFAVVFFTSATCPPCKAVYPIYDQLAAEVDERGTLIKIDVGVARDVGMKYAVSSTPTFMTFLKGKQLERWSGATPAKLSDNVRMLLEMAYPAHPHRQLELPSLQREITNLVMYKKVPPLDKLLQKLPVSFKEARGVTEVIKFIQQRYSTTVPADIKVPDLHTFATTLKTTYPTLPVDSHFAVVDLVRLLLLDPRISGYFAEEAQHTTLLTLLAPTDLPSCPYNLRIVALQLACNLFSTPLYPEQLTSSSSPLRKTCLGLATNSLLDSHASLRVVAASFAYNLAAYNHNARFNGRPDPLSEEDQVELTASLLEAVAREDQSVEALHGLLYALGLIVYEAPMDGALIDLCRAMGVTEDISAKMKIEAVQKEPLLKEIGGELFGKGLVTEG
ncbi:uncharacterized protein N7515_009702 [Penicillium bovifimosum]|uniref:Thioredoxin n=1 Tax=Penicillium bovifimosum TaxID=126998 RepID=A0A9W9GI48_9EURO|nr:uncharacterized protein N7515_009702 [Penicillium bovifimosum]KAJ5120314.1 hypothetical protein N7515_009702 [Penicillium bovifimosum]